ncbi:hypothetical protein CF319_g1461 [Tilletia indica]|uniref:Uncharacterized protein n=1 Tax=Tilletia indica TaxID=43049 RepID=A0A177TXI1_9BASI|nr:hypothetical protein CF319_g1461 [Tilletia indica]KAE8234806.1 hypothetical protein CF326_g158 [Tilletia indica]KAE8246659.1 hypothetical protein A4X13_0g5682 [Tilletia indica]
MGSCSKARPSPLPSQKNRHRSSDPPMVMEKTRSSTTLHISLTSRRHKNRVQDLPLTHGPYSASSQTPSAANKP